MAESEVIQTIFMHLAIQAATAAVMVMIEADVGPTSDTNTVSLDEACRYRQCRPSLRQPSFNWLFSS